jgi:hypothetical protein
MCQTVFRVPLFRGWRPPSGRAEKASIFPVIISNPIRHKGVKEAVLTTSISPQRILKSIPKNRNRAVTADKLSEALGLTESQEARLREYLSEFVRAGMVSAKGGRYWRKGDSGFIIGTLRGTRSGHAFVVPEDERERERGDLFVGESSMGRA